MSNVAEVYFEGLDECPECKSKEMKAVVLREEVYFKGELGISRDEFPNGEKGVLVTCENCGAEIDRYEEFV